MSRIIRLSKFSGANGTLIPVDKEIPFSIKRVFYIYSAKGVRGGHRHKKTRQALIVIKGKCVIYVTNGKLKKKVILNNPTKCLIVEPKDWHTMGDFSKDCILLVLASEHYKKSDYIYEGYK